MELFVVCGNIFTYCCCRGISISIAVPPDQVMKDWRRNTDGMDNKFDDDTLCNNKDGNENCDVNNDIDNNPDNLDFLSYTFCEYLRKFGTFKGNTEFHPV